MLASAGEWTGKEGVRDYFVKSRADWDVRKHDVIEFMSSADHRFAVRVAVEVVNRRTGGRVGFEKVDLVTMTNGKCTLYQEVFDSVMLERAAGHGPSER